MDKENFNIAEFAEDINKTNISTDIKDSLKTIQLPNIEGHELDLAYGEWSKHFQEEKFIKGMPFGHWLVEEFYIDKSCLSDSPPSIEAIRKLSAICLEKQTKASNYLKTARLKYNGAILNASVRYLVHYEKIMSKNESEYMNMRNATKEKIKMLAEAKNKEAIVLAILADEEVKFWEQVLEDIKNILSVIRIVNELREQEMRLSNYSS